MGRYERRVARQVWQRISPTDRERVRREHPELVPVFVPQGVKHPTYANQTKRQRRRDRARLATS